jgi:hypothetical protein
MEVIVPTLEERQNENAEDLNQRLEAKTMEMGITHTFAQYLEQMETYLLQLEQRVSTLEHDLAKSNPDTTE